MIIIFLIINILCVSLPAYAESLDKPLIYNQEALTAQLKGQSKEEVLKVLGEPAVKKPCEECEENLEYWWYNLPEAGVFVHFKDGIVTRISVINEDKRSREI